MNTLVMNSNYKIYGVFGILPYAITVELRCWVVVQAQKVLVYSKGYAHRLCNQTALLSTTLSALCHESVI